MTKHSKSKWLLAGVLSGALALGTACKSDSGSERASEPVEPPAGTESTGTETDTPPPNGTGGAGWDTRSTSESEPGVHEGDLGGSGEADTPNHQVGSEEPSPVEEPGTGGGGLDEGMMEDEEVIIDDPSVTDPGDVGTEPGTGGSGIGTDDGVGGSGAPLNEGGNPIDAPLPDDTGEPGDLY